MCWILHIETLLLKILYAAEIGMTNLLFALLRQVLIHSHSLRLLRSRLGWCYNRRLWHNGSCRRNRGYNRRGLCHSRLLWLVNLILYLARIILRSLRLTIYNCISNRSLHTTTLLLYAITNAIHYAAEVMVNKYASQNPASNHHQQSTKTTQQIRQILCAGLSQLSANIISYTPLIGYQTHSQRANNEQQRGTQCKVIEMQRLLAENTPTENGYYNRNYNAKDAKRAIHHPIGHRSTYTATYILKLYLHTRKFGIVTQSREVRRPMNKVRQDRNQREYSYDEH